MKIKKLIISSFIAMGIASACFGLTAAAEQRDVPRLPDGVSLSDFWPQTTFESTDGVTESVDSADYTSKYLYWTYGKYTPAQQAEMDAALDELLEGIDPEWSDLSKLIYAHDALVKAVDYDHTLTNGYAYDMLTKKTGICNAYSETMWLLMYRLNIDCRIVMSETLNHDWNIVCLDGKWYHIDATWNDTDEETPYMNYCYFLRSDDDFNSSHTGWNDQVFYWYEDSYWNNGAYWYSGSNQSSAVGVAPDTRFDDYFWYFGINGIIGPGSVHQIIVVDDNYYYIDGEGLKRADENNNTKLLVDMSDIKYSWGGLSTAYLNIQKIGNLLYFNTPTELMSYNLKSGKLSSVYTYSGASTDHEIYGFTFKDNVFTLKIQDYVKPKNHESTITVSIELLKPTLSATQAKGKINLSWKAVDGATSYRVYRANSATGEKTLLKTVGTTSCTDTTAVFGNTYYYFVQAYSSKTELLSPISDCRSLKYTSLAPPTLNSVTLNEKTVKLSWTAVPNATSYKIYRGTSATSAKTLIKTVGITSCNDTSAIAGSTNYYYIVAYSSKTNSMSAASNTKSVTVPTSVAAPTIKSITQAKGVINLSWSAVSNATSYRVYRATSATGTKTLLKTVGITSCTDTSAVVGTTYYYFIQAYNSKTATASLYSDYKTLKFTSLAPPVLSSVSTDNSTVSLKWSAVPYATSYRIYRGTSAAGAKSLIKTVGITSCNDTTVTKGETYYYYIVAYSSKTGTMSAASNSKSITLGGIAAPVITNTSVNDDRDAILSWSAVKGATSYQVYRATSSTGTKTLIQTVNTNSCIDTTAIAGRTYYYYITAYNSATNEVSDYSVGCLVMIPLYTLSS